MQPFGRNGYGPKLGGCAPLGEGELGPHLTQCGQGRGLPACPVFHLDPSNRLATVHERYRQDRIGQDRQDRQRSDSIGRTVLQTVAQKRTSQQNPFAYYHRSVKVSDELMMSVG